MTDEIVRPYEIWGPRAGFKFGLLEGGQAREGGGLSWARRAMIMSYFVEHDNEPASWVEIDTWIEAMTPLQVRDAVGLAIAVGLP